MSFQFLSAVISELLVAFLLICDFYDQPHSTSTIFLF